MNTNKTLTVRGLYEALDGYLPRTLSCDWDNDGLAVCPDPAAAVRRILVALDPTEDVVAYAEAEGYDVILTHHPLLFRGIKAVDGADTASRKVIRLVTAGIAAMSFHTRLDAADGGVNDTLAGLLGLSELAPFGDDGNPAGKPIGRVGTLPAPQTLSAFAERVKTALGAPGVLCADSGRAVCRVAVMGGAGEDDIAAARAAGADTYVTGELRYHHLCDAPYEGMNLIAAGHYHTEFPVCAVLRDMALRAVAEAGLEPVEVTVYGACRVALM